MPDDTTARAIAERFRPSLGNWMRGQTPMHEWLASEIDAALDEARLAAIEGAARVADRYAMLAGRMYEDGAGSEYEYASAECRMCAAAIRQIGFSGEEGK